MNHSFLKHIKAVIVDYSVLCVAGVIRFLYADKECVVLDVVLTGQGLYRRVVAAPYIELFVGHVEHLLKPCGGRAVFRNSGKLTGRVYYARDSILRKSR